MSRKILIGLLPAWVAYLGVVILFYPSSGDAPSYFYGIMRMVDGWIPNVDFFSIQPPGFYLPYYLVAKLTVPSWEALRYFALASFIVTSLIVTYIVRKRYGDTLGLMAFMIMGTSHFWFYWNANIIHYSVSNLTLLIAFALISFATPTRPIAFLAGFVAGLCVNARLSMGPTTVLLLYLLLQKFRASTPEETWRQSIARLGIPFVLGGVLAATPGLIVFLMDPEAAFIQFLGLRSQLEMQVVVGEGSVWDQIQSVISQRLSIVWAFFFWADDSLKAQIGNAIVIALLGIAGGVLVTADARRRRESARAFRQDPLVRSSALVILVVFFTHALSVLPSPYYVQAIFPFLTIVALGAVYYGFQATRNQRHRVAAGTLIGICLIPYVLYFIFWTGGHLIRRNEPSSARPVTNALSACWIEQNMGADAKILSHSGWPVASAGRHMIPTWTYPPFQSQLVTWDIPPTVAQKAHILTRAELLRLVETQELDLYVEEKSTANDLRGETAFHRAFKNNYRLAATTGGAFPFLHYLPIRLWRADLPQIPVPSLSRLSIKRLREAPPGTLLSELTTDLGQSVAELGEDLGLAYTRLIGAPFERRCRKYLEQAGGRPLQWGGPKS